MADVLEQISESLRAERGMLLRESGQERWHCAIWRKGNNREHGTYRSGMTVGEFLLDPANQSGTWLIDGGWGGPPGPIYVRWNGTAWEDGGFGGYRFDPT